VFNDWETKQLANCSKSNRSLNCFYRLKRIWQNSKIKSDIFNCLICNHFEGSMVGKNVVAEVAGTCLLLRSRLVSRVITAIYDEKLRPFKIGSAQFALLVVICQIEPATRAEIGRNLHLDRSTLTRHLRVILAEGWAEEVQDGADGRSRPIVLTKAGRDLLHEAVPAWRAAQERAKALLGRDGVIAVMDIANRIMEPVTQHLSCHRLAHCF
jgi:DNA-binding MarR family transcriptional regulator